MNMKKLLANYKKERKIITEEKNTFNIIDISYKSYTINKTEKTELMGLMEGDYFFLGNNNGYKVLIKKVYQDRILLLFDKKFKYPLPNNSREVEIKIGEEFKIAIPIDNSPFLTVDRLTYPPSFTIKLNKIGENSLEFWA